jgi:hypothetical protein
MLSRREYLASRASLALTAGIGTAHAAMGPNDKFDLLIKGGDVLESQPILARTARYRHSLWRHRSGGGRYPGGTPADAAPDTISSDIHVFSGNI